MLKRFGNSKTVQKLFNRYKAFLNQLVRKGTLASCGLCSFKCASSWQNQQNDCAPCEDSDQLGIRPVWSESSLCPQWVAKDPSFLHADSQDLIRLGDVSLRWDILLLLSWGGSLMCMHSNPVVPDLRKLRQVPYIVWANKGLGETVRMHRLSWAFTVSPVWYAPFSHKLAPKRLNWNWSPPINLSKFSWNKFKYDTGKHLLELDKKYYSLDSSELNLTNVNKTLRETKLKSACYYTGQI